MIFVERDDEFVMITQHDHAYVSGQIAEGLPPQWFKSGEHRRAVILAVREHDRGWIGLDHTPIWNDAKQTPYSFMDYPLRPKLVFYKKGVDEVEAVNPLGAILCSRYYVSFFTGTDVAQPDEVLEYVEQERARQQRLLEQLQLITHEQIDVLESYYQMMQFCDNASLYVCLNEPGVSKQQEFAWYRQGFRQRFEALDQQVIVPEWLSVSEVSLKPFPFKEETKVQLAVKCVKKALIQELGLAQAYKQTEIEMREFSFVDVM